MSQRDLERRLHDVSDRASRQVHRYADSAADTAQGWIERGRRAASRLNGRGSSYRKQIARKAEDLADEANYQYRRLRRQVSRHPVATAAIVAGTIGAFLLLRRVLRSDDDED